MLRLAEGSNRGGTEGEILLALHTEIAFPPAHLVKDPLRQLAKGFIRAVSVLGARRMAARSVNPAVSIGRANACTRPNVGCSWCG